MNIKTLREQKGVTQIELAKYLGVVKSTICQYEKGNRQPDTASLIKLADFFGVSVDYLLGRDTQKNLIERPPYEITDKQTLDIIKLCKIMTEIQKAQVFGYIVALLEQAGINVENVLRY